MLYQVIIAVSYRVSFLTMMMMMQQKYYKQKQTENADCQQHDKTAEHAIQPCPVLAKEQHVKRRDSVCAQLHCDICKEGGVKL
jgi:hypothetical protein